MTSFLEELWNSIFTPGPTPTLLVATNATFAALQFLLFILLITTYSIHFAILSVLCGGLWYSINWFARELQAEKAREEAAKPKQIQVKKKDRSPEPESDTETEAAPPMRKPPPSQAKERDPNALLKPKAIAPDELRKRRRLGESSGYVSTDSEWEKVSEGEEKQ